MQQEDQQAEPEGQEESPPTDDYHILVVDDERDIRDVLCTLIRSDGYRATAVPGGHEALAVLEKTKVDLVLTDLMMPEMTGWQLLTTIKEERPEILVVVITGYISEHGEELLTNPNVDGYLPKPFDHRRLKVLMNALLSPRNLGRTAEVVAVDDDPDITSAISHVLSQRGLYVTTFQNPEDAHHHIRTSPPHLAIIDLMYPGADGFDLCKFIRSDPDTALMPILILTGHPSRQNVSRAIELGVNGFLVKPFDPEELSERSLKVIRQAGVVVKR